MIFDLAARDPDGVAVDDLVRQRSWAELAERSVRAARFMREEARLAPGDHVAVLMENRVEYVELILGAIMAGVWITPINWHLAREEIAYVIEDSGAKLLISDVNGRRVRLLERHLGAGRQSVEWDGTNDGGARVAAGVYYYRVEVGSSIGTGRVLRVH